MTTSKLPAHPSLESLRKQAKKLARSIVAGDAGAIRRARAQLPQDLKRLALQFDPVSVATQLSHFEIDLERAEPYEWPGRRCAQKNEPGRSKVG